MSYNQIKYAIYSWNVVLFLISLCLLFLQFQYLPNLSYKVAEERRKKQWGGGTVCNNT